MQGFECQISTKMLWRFFCVDCFDRIAGDIPARTSHGAHNLRTIYLIRLGKGGPFGSEVPANVVQPAYERSSSMIRSALHFCITIDFQK